MTDLVFCVIEEPSCKMKQKPWYGRGFLSVSREDYMHLLHFPEPGLNVYWLFPNLGDALQGLTLEWVYEGGLYDNSFNNLENLHFDNE